MGRRTSRARTEPPGGVRRRSSFATIHRFVYSWIRRVRDAPVNSSGSTTNGRSLNTRWCSVALMSWIESNGDMPSTRQRRTGPSSPHRAIHVSFATSGGAICV